MKHGRSPEQIQRSQQSGESVSKPLVNSSVRPVAWTVWHWTFCKFRHSIDVFFSPHRTGPPRLSWGQLSGDWSSHCGTPPHLPRPLTFATCHVNNLVNQYFISWCKPLQQIAPVVHRRFWVSYQFYHINGTNVWSVAGPLFIEFHLIVWRLFLPVLLNGI